MARDTPAVAVNSPVGILIALTAVSANNDAIANNGRRTLHVKNASGGSINVTIKAPAAATVGGLPLADKVVAVANGVEWEFGPWGAEWNQPGTNNEVWVDYSAT